jgi:hypothetical protein
VGRLSDEEELKEVPAPTPHPRSRNFMQRSQMLWSPRQADWQEPGPVEYLKPVICRIVHTDFREFTVHAVV